jgi:prevent-host-death family protein
VLTRNHTRKKSPPAGTWKLQDAKARFSEVVKRAQSEGPQRVTVHGRDAVVVVSAAQFEKTAPSTSDTRTGEELIKAMQQARKLGLRLRPIRVPAMARRPIDLPESEK